MEAVHVLGGVHAMQHAPSVHVLRERQLDQDPVNLVVRVEPLDEREQLRLGGLEGEPDRFVVQPGLVARLAFHVDVGGGGRVLADQHRGEPGHHALRLELADLALELGAHRFADGLAVDQLSGQNPPPGSRG